MNDSHQGKPGDDSKSLREQVHELLPELEQLRKRCLPDPVPKIISDDYRRTLAAALNFRELSSAEEASEAIDLVDPPQAEEQKHIDAFISRSDRHALTLLCAIRLYQVVARSYPEEPTKLWDARKEHFVFASKPG
jgi:hypothetical protein